MSVFFKKRGEESLFKSAFADNDWEKIIRACQSGLVPDSWDIGDSKLMAINGTEYRIDIIGRNHDIYSDGTGTAPLTFQLHDCYGTNYAMHSAETNSGGWKSCVMRTTHLPSILLLMPSEVQSAIRKVDKLTSEGKKSSTIVTTQDSLFLLSEVEVLGATTHSVTGEGTQYAYYAGGGNKIKNQSGVANNWWLRSPTGSANNAYCQIKTTGGAGSYYPNYARCVSFAFCF
jgi:hypothetical protein